MPEFIGLFPYTLFPFTLDDWGTAKEDNDCEIIAAEDWNHISAAVVAVGSHTKRVMKTGQAGVLTHTPTGTTRPKVLFKVLTVTATGAQTWEKSFTLPAFTSAEKTLFGGTPLASGNCIHLQARMVPGNPIANMAYRASLVGPIADPSGDSGWDVVLTPLGNDMGDRVIKNGEYAITVFITSP